MDELPEKWNRAQISTADSPRWASVTMIQQRKVRLTAISILGCFLLLFLFSSYDQTRSFSSLPYASQTCPTHNRTLGFQKVYAVGLPRRTDKHDAMNVAASCSGIDLEWHDGVMFDDIDKKAIPAKFDNILTQDWAPSAIGCWRAHLNILSSMVEKNIASALILEDDSDWDVSLKDQLEQFGKGLTELQSDLPGTSPQGSPYGSNWDLLWLGQCDGGPRDGLQDMYFIHNDSTVPPVLHRTGKWKNDHILAEVVSDNTRIIHRTGNTMCTLSYAITFEGALKVLTALSLRGGKGNQIDFELSDMCNNDTDMATSLNCFAIHPRLIGPHRFAGSASRDSDIWALGEDNMHDEFTQDITYSTTKNAARLLSGAEDALSQWPEDTIPSRRLDEDYASQVWGERRQIDLNAVPIQSVPGINAVGFIDLEQLDRSLLPST